MALGVEEDGVVGLWLTDNGLYISIYIYIYIYIYRPLPAGQIDYLIKLPAEAHIRSKLSQINVNPPTCQALNAETIPRTI